MRISASPLVTKSNVMFACSVHWRAKCSTPSCTFLLPSRNLTRSVRPGCQSFPRSRAISRFEACWFRLYSATATRRDSSRSSSGRMRSTQTWRRLGMMDLPSATVLRVPATRCRCDLIAVNLDRPIRAGAFDLADRPDPFHLAGRRQVRGFLVHLEPRKPVFRVGGGVDWRRRCGFPGDDLEVLGRHKAYVEPCVVVRLPGIEAVGIGVDALADL